MPYTLRLCSGQAWDNNGNLLSDGVSTHTYDHANRLASVSQGAPGQQVDLVRLGAGAGIDASTVGLMYFDRFEARR